MSPQRHSEWVSRYASLRTGDLDLARLAVGAYFYAHQLELLRSSDRLDVTFELLRFGPIALGDMRYGAEVRASFGELGAYHVDLLMSGHLSGRHANRPFVGTASTASVFGPIGDTVVDRVSADCRALALKIERVALERHLEALLDGPVSAPLHLAQGLDVTRAPGRGWARLVRVLSDEITNHSGLVYQPMVAERLSESLLTGLLLATQHPYRDALARSGPAPAPGVVRRVVDAIHTHPEAAWATTRLAELAGVSVRSLQEGFRRHVGVSPLTYLRGVRLARAHDDLLRAEPESGICRVVCF